MKRGESPRPGLLTIATHAVAITALGHLVVVAVVHTAPLHTVLAGRPALAVGTSLGELGLHVLPDFAGFHEAGLGLLHGLVEALGVVAAALKDVYHTHSYFSFV